MKNLTNLALRHQAIWIVLGCLVLGSIGGFVVSRLSPATYTSSTQLFIGSPAAGDSAGLYQGDLFSQQRAATYAELFGGDDLATKVIDDLSLDTTPSELAEHVSASAVEGTVLLDVTVTDDTAKGAADIANAYASNFARYVGQLENPDGGSSPNTQVSVIRRAEAPQAPSSPSVGLNVIGGLVVGGIIGGAVVWLRRRFDTTVQNIDDAADLVDAAGLGLLPADPDRETALLRLPQQASAPYAEALRKLRTTIQFTDPQRPVQRMVVVGADDGDGAHAVAAHLALMFGEVGRRVVLVDADLRMAPLNAYLPAGDEDSVKGLSDVLHGVATVDDSVVSMADGRFDLIPAGTATATPAEDLASPAMSRLIDDLHSRYTYVVLLGAAASEYTDAAVIAVGTDGVILVARAGSTKDAVLAEAGAAVRSAGARLLGVLLTSGLRARAAKPPRTVQRTPLPAVQRSPRSAGALEPPRPARPAERQDPVTERMGAEDLQRVRQAYSAPQSSSRPSTQSSSRPSSESRPPTEQGWGTTASAPGRPERAPSPIPQEAPSREIARLDPMRWSAAEPIPSPSGPAQPTVDETAMTEPISIVKTPRTKRPSEPAPQAPDPRSSRDNGTGMTWAPTEWAGQVAPDRHVNGNHQNGYGPNGHSPYGDHDVIDAEVVDVEEDGGPPPGWRSSYKPGAAGGAHRLPSGEFPKVDTTGTRGNGAHTVGYPGMSGARIDPDSASEAPESEADDEAAQSDDGDVDRGGNRDRSGRAGDSYAVGGNRTGNSSRE